ncbi:MAG: hypothetical protein U9N53_10310 [Bacteroidota bacterium]|nr:hypothetical protein [Bacteroidota bacterium]
MKNHRTTILRTMILGISIILIPLSSCKNTAKSPKESQVEIEDVRDQIGQEVSDFVYPLPASYEVTEMLNRIGIPYMLGTANSVENVNKYFTAKSKAYNIGVYGSDLSYASTYQMTQETMLYLEAITQLGNDLGISSIYNEDLLSGIEENINSKDTLVGIITTTVYDTYDFLHKNGKGDLALLMVAGGWIEAMYLTTNVSANVANNPEIVSIIYAQKASLEKLMEILNERSEEANIQELIGNFAPVIEAYDKVENEKMTEKQVSAILLAVEQLRGKIIN